MAPLAPSDGIWEPQEKTTCVTPEPNPAHEIKEQVAERAELVFDVVSENPQKPHVADDVEKSAVQKHAGDQRQEGLQGGVAVSFKRHLNVRRCKGVGLDESLSGRWRQS